MTTSNRSDLGEIEVTIEEWPAPPGFMERGRIERRRDALEKLDPMVRRVLGGANRLAGAGVDLTMYDEIYPSNPAVGGHWTTASRWVGLLWHSVSSISVSLCFDARDRPVHFVINGAREVVTADTSETAFAHALDTVRAGGPLLTSAPHVFQSLVL